MNASILSHQFDNGLILAAESMDWSESAAFTFLVPGGSVHDPDDRAGLGNFTCEMSLRGCGDRDSRQFMTDLDNLGVERAQSVSDLHTAHIGAAAASSLPDVLGIYADLLLRPRMPADQLELGRNVMLQELAGVEDDLHYKLMIELRKQRHREPWGRPSQGDEAGVSATTLEDVKSHHEQLTRPNGSILAVAGRFDWETLKSQVERLFGDWKPGPETPVVEKGERGKYLHVSEDSEQTQVGIAYGAVPYSHADYFPAWAAVSALSGGMSSRLFTEVREKKGLCYSVYATYYMLPTQASVLCYAGTERGQETLDVMLAELTRMKDGVDDSELRRVKARCKSSLVMQEESTFSRSASIARDWQHLGRARTLDETQRLVDGLSTDRVNDYLAANPPADFTIVTLGPEPLEVPVGIS
ncbi:MAG: insulinase family protein [Planctomycetales bacterium]